MGDAVELFEQVGFDIGFHVVYAFQIVRLRTWCIFAKCLETLADIRVHVYFSATTKSAELLDSFPRPAFQMA